VTGPVPITRRQPVIDHARIITSAMTENDLDRIVRSLAGWLGIRVYSVRNSRAGIVTSAGYPDLTLVGPGGIAFRELKSERGRPTREQLDWGQALTAAGQDFRIWRPGDLQAGTIEIELRLLSRQPPENGR
jgi:hypothetical protein